MVAHTPSALVARSSYKWWVVAMLWLISFFNYADRPGVIGTVGPALVLAEPVTATAGAAAVESEGFATPEEALATYLEALAVVLDDLEHAGHVI